MDICVVLRFSFCREEQVSIDGTVVTGMFIEIDKLMKSSEAKDSSEREGEELRETGCHVPSSKNSTGSATTRPGSG